MGDTEEASEFKEPNEVKIADSDKAKYFPKCDYSKLRFTDVALYSTTPTDQTVYTTNLLLSYYSEDELKDKVITDANACIGGNTWSFAKKLKKVNAVEISSVHMDILKNNMSVILGEAGNNIDYILDNYVKVMHELEQDIVFMDPPWGGVDYRNNVDLSYTYKGKRYSLDDVLNGYIAYRCEMIVLKLPMNADYQKLKKTNFPYYEEVLIQTADKRPIYKIVILSHIPPVSKPAGATFPKLQYKLIKVL